MREVGRDAVEIIGRGVWFYLATLSETESADVNGPSFGETITMGHWDRDQDGLEDSVYETGGNDSDRIEEVRGNDSSGSDIDEEDVTMKGVKVAIKSENGDLSDLSETNESDSKDESEPPITLHLISFLAFLL